MLGEGRCFFRGITTSELPMVQKIPPQPCTNKLPWLISVFTFFKDVKVGRDLLEKEFQRAWEGEKRDKCKQVNVTKIHYIHVRNCQRINIFKIQTIRQ